MTVLARNLAIFQLISLWRPISWTFGWKYLCYNIYTYFVLVLMFSSVFTELVKLLGSFESTEQLLNNATVLLTMIGNCAKAANLVNKREDIGKLLKTLVSYPCSPQDLKERSIQQKYDKIIRFRTTANITLVGSAITVVILESIICDLPVLNLPYDAWYPFDVSISYNYWIAWLHQILAHIFGAITSANYDAFVPGLMLQSCAKFDILNYRLSNILHKIRDNSHESKLDKGKQISEGISDFVKFHLKIIEFIHFANDILSSVIFLQFSISVQVICVTVYALSKTTINDPHFPALIIYLACMLIQLFLFCYAGSELTLKSEAVAKSIYCNVDWYSSSIDMQKKLLLIFMSSSYVVKFTCGNIIDLSIDSYTRVVKLSYSIYNVLQ